LKAAEREMLSHEGREAEGEYPEEGRRRGSILKMNEDSVWAMKAKKVCNILSQ